jgi:hypothetical protein
VDIYSKYVLLRELHYAKQSTISINELIYGLKTLIMLKISGSRGGQYEDESLQRCCAVQYGKSTELSPVLAASIIAEIIVLKMDTKNLGVTIRRTDT